MADDIKVGIAVDNKAALSAIEQTKASLAGMKRQLITSGGAVPYDAVAAAQRRIASGATDAAKAMVAQSHAAAELKAKLEEIVRLEAQLAAIDSSVSGGGGMGVMGAAGGVMGGLAIAEVFGRVVQKFHDAEEAARKLTWQAEQMNQQFTTEMNFASLEDLPGIASRAASGIQELRSKLDDLAHSNNTFWGPSKIADELIARLTGAATEGEKIKQITQSIAQAQAKVGEAMDEQARLGQKEVDISALRLAGYNAEADEQQRLLDLEKAKAKIRAEAQPGTGTIGAVKELERQAALKQEMALVKENAKVIADIREKQSAADIKAEEDKNKKKMALEESVAKFVRDKNEEAAKEQEKLIKETTDFERKQKEDFFKWEEEQLKKKHALERKRLDEQLKAAEAQKSSALEAGQQAAQGVAGGVSLPTQRWYEQAQRTNDARVAGVVARDAARRKFGNDADVMASKKVKDWIKDTKEALMPEMKGDVGDLNSAINNVALIKTAIQNLEQKLGIK